jgi:hypothetical protein
MGSLLSSGFCDFSSLGRLIMLFAFCTFPLFCLSHDLNECFIVARFSESSHLVLIVLLYDTWGMFLGALNPRPGEFLGHLLTYLFLIEKTVCPDLDLVA